MNILTLETFPWGSIILNCLNYFPRQKCGRKWTIITKHHILQKEREWHTKSAFRVYLECFEPVASDNGLQKTALSAQTTSSWLLPKIIAKRSTSKPISTKRPIRKLDLQKALATQADEWRVFQAIAVHKKLSPSHASIVQKSDLHEGKIRLL